jgi:cytoskeletal protein CcmA (bactofilin family)
MAIFGAKQKDLMSSNISSIISEGCIVDGIISTNSSLRVDGIVNGDVNALEGVIIGNKGKVLGNIKAAEAIVFGTVEGNMTVQKLEIQSTGLITGDIQTESMIVEFGAHYNGRVKMTGGTAPIKVESNHGALNKLEA